MISEVFNIDCFDGLKKINDNSIPCIVTDPPYGLNYNDGDLANNREKIFGGKIKNMKPNPIQNDGKEADIIFEKFLHEAKRILINGGCCCCCCCGGGGPKPLFAKWTLMMDKIIGFKQAVIWDKGGLGMGMQYRRNYEFILIAQKGSPSHAWNGGNNTPNVWRINKIIPNKNQHPTEKPIKLMQKIIYIHSNPGDIILDPFMGHGSTGVAAIIEGRRFIGYEIEKRFYDVACQRIEAEESKLKLFK